jgi:hopanoid C-2 methylase
MRAASGSHVLGFMRRRILLVYPKFTRTSLFGYHHLAKLMPGKRAVMPSLGLITFGALLDRSQWEVRLIDENVQTLTDEQLNWADVVALSGMHMQRERLTALLSLANDLGKLTVVGGPSVSICPEYYPMADALHVGEVGDATSELLSFLHSTDEKPAQQRIFRTEVKTPLEELPLPAIDLLDVHAYLSMPVQFSVGCPYTCEFCDIPIIYGRVARYKSGPRLLRELDAISRYGFIGTVAFADDNLIANRKAFRPLLQELAAWQRAHGYPFPLSGEATINIARDEDILSAMHDAGFQFLFVGVESPDEETLKQIKKKQNTQDPIVASLRTIQSYGIETLLGIIFGFDTDTEETGKKVTQFLREANSPIIYFNLLAALPKTALWERLSRENRLRRDEGGDALQSANLLGGFQTNVEFTQGNELIERMLGETVRAAYAPEELFRRFAWNVEHVYTRQIQGRPPVRNLRELAYFLWLTSGMALRLLDKVALHSSYRLHFWQFLGELVRLRREGKIRSVVEMAMRVAPHAHHLITWANELLAGQAHLDLEPQRTGRPPDLVTLSSARPVQGQLSAQLDTTSFLPGWAAPKA